MNNYKLKVNPEMSKDIQKFLFTKGYSWAGEKTTQYANKPHMYVTTQVESNKYITYGSDRKWFLDKPFKRVTPEQLKRLLS